MSLLCLLLLVACKADQRGEGGGPTAATDQARPSAPSASRSTRSEAERRPGPTGAFPDEKSGPSYLIVIGSWKLGDTDPPQSIPEELLDLRFQSIRPAPGFPRRAHADEIHALRPGYGALLAGICDDEAAALSVVRAIETESGDVYMKASPRTLANACPRPDKKWLLGHELALAVESSAPDASERVKKLLEDGASPNHGRGSATPLNRAAYNNDIALVRLLLTRGALVNIPDRAPQEESTLELAIRSPYGDPLEMVRLLVSHGADVNATTEGAEADPGSTVELTAIRQCRPQVLEFLQAKGTKREAVPDDEICRDRHPPEAPAADRAGILRLLGKR